jgi:hypothetical protein
MPQIFTAEPDAFIRLYPVLKNARLNA